MILFVSTNDIQQHFRLPRIATSREKIKTGNRKKLVLKRKRIAVFTNRRICYQHKTVTVLSIQLSIVMCTEIMFFSLSALADSKTTPDSEGLVKSFLKTMEAHAKLHNLSLSFDFQPGEWMATFVKTETFKPACLTHQGSICFPF